MRATITGREWRAVLIYAALLTLLTLLPYLLAWGVQGNDQQFSGFLFGIDDGNSYLGKMRLGVRGLWDFYVFYTPEPHEGVPLVFLPYIVPGQIIGLFMADSDPALATVMAAVFHLMRVIFNLLMIAVLYRFIAAFVRSPGMRFTALVLATLGGGMGWLLGLAGELPPEFYIPEGFSFLVLLSLPHLALSRAAMLGGFLFLMGSADAIDRVPTMGGTEAMYGLPTDGKGGSRSVLSPQSSVLFAGLCWLVVGMAVPFYLTILYVILGMWGLTAWVRTRRFPLGLAMCCIPAALITLPLFLYYAVVFSSNPTFAQWSAQNILQSPSPLLYLAAYIVLLVPAIPGAMRAWRLARRDIRYALMIGWPVIVPLLVYLPINVQRRMAEAVIVPLAILATLGLRAMARWLAHGRGRRAYRRSLGRARLALAVLASLSSVFVLMGAFLTALSTRPPIFRPNNQLEAFAWLNQHAAPDEIVLAAVPTSNALPAYTNLRPFMGHGPETLFWQEKSEQVTAFFSGEMSAEKRAALVEQFNIRYILYGEPERELQAALDDPPAWADDWTLIYDAAGYQIFEAQ